jgi:pimeloyl-ACP methyl ester carboxylesterase
LHVVLLHGLARSISSMRTLGRDLVGEGHTVHPIAYRSRQAPLLTLAREVDEALRERGLGDGGPDVGFVCHSMGGIVLRALAQIAPERTWGRSVLLGCPIQGSMLAARLGAARSIRFVFGPSLGDLAPDRVRELPAPPCPFGVIAGSTWSPLLPGAYFLRAWAPGQPSDSTVLVEETRTDAAADHLVIRGVHSFLADSPEARRQVRAFLRSGSFERP